LELSRSRRPDWISSFLVTEVVAEKRSFDLLLDFADLRSSGGGAVTMSSTMQEVTSHLRSSAGKAAYLQPLVRRLFSESVTGAQRVFDTKWSVPGVLEASCGCGSSSEGGA
jgi:hypothetical protein